MGIWSWLKKRICSEKDTQSVHTPAFEPLEPRILFSGDIGASDLWDLSLDSQVDQVIAADLYAGSQTSTQALSGPCRG
jgi:hypothetical protein